VVRQPLRVYAWQAFGLKDGRHLFAFCRRHASDFAPLECDACFEHLTLDAHADVLTRGHAECACNQPGDSGQHDHLAAGLGSRDANDQRGVRYESIVCAKDGSPQSASACCGGGRVLILHRLQPPQRFVTCAVAGWHARLDRHHRAPVPLTFAL
jgi:hypothetical protein